METEHLLFFVNKRSCISENQNTLCIAVLMSDIVFTGAYELLEKQNEGYETN